MEICFLEPWQQKGEGIPAGIENVDEDQARAPTNTEKDSNTDTADTSVHIECGQEKAQDAGTHRFWRGRPRKAVHDDCIEKFQRPQLEGDRIKVNFFEVVSGAWVCLDYTDREPIG